MQDGGISRQRSFYLPAGGLSTFSSRSDVVESGAKWSWAPRTFYLLHFLRSHHHLSHLFVFFVVSFLWRRSEDKRKSPVIGYSQDRNFFKKWKKSILGVTNIDNDDPK